MMKTRNIIILAAAFMLFGAKAQAFDLDQYKHYLSGSASKQISTQKDNRSRNNVKPLQEPAYPVYSAPQQQYAPYQSFLPQEQSFSPDAYFVQGNPGEYVPLNSNATRPGERYLLPGETRVPKEITPLLTERKTPKQGLASVGGSGATLVPSPGVIEPNKTAVGVHLQMYDLVNNIGSAYTDQDYFDTVISASWGIEDGFEVGFDKTLDNQDRFDIEEPLYLNFKYQVPGNVTLGGSINCDGGYHSVWVAAGVPVAWFGVGGNFGESDYKFSYSMEPDKYHGHLKRAKFGGYNFDTNTAVGHPDEFFFFLGGVVPLNNTMKFVYDFNGDKFSLGFRFSYKNMINVNVSYISEGDYDNLNTAISHKEYQGCVVGASVLF